MSEINKKWTTSYSVLFFFLFSVSFFFQMSSNDHIISLFSNPDFYSQFSKASKILPRKRINKISKNGKVNTQNIWKAVRKITEKQTTPSVNLDFATTIKNNWKRKRVKHWFKIFGINVRKLGNNFFYIRTILLSIFNPCFVIAHCYVLLTIVQYFFTTLSLIVIIYVINWSFTHMNIFLASSEYVHNFWYIFNFLFLSFHNQFIFLYSIFLLIVFFNQSSISLCQSFFFS